MRYTKKPVMIEALQWDGSYESMMKIRETFSDLRCSSTYHQDNNTVQSFVVYTLEGQHVVSPGDFVIKGVKGEFYPCKPDIFELTYDKVNDV